VPDDPRAQREDARAAEAQRRRLYNLGALAQSYPPKGVADLFKRPPSAPPWRERPRRERVALCAVLAAETALAGVIVAGVAAHSVALVLLGAGLLLALILGTAAVTVRSELGRRGRTTRGRPPRQRR
jgi:hypothetical protein